jgi:pseudouridine-5'-phosphate glycosidase/pseudouridine kinase
LTHIAPNLIELEDLANRLQNGSNAVDSLPFDLTKHERDIGAYCKPEPRRWISDQQVIPKILALLPSVSENVWLKAGSNGLLHATFNTADRNQNSDGDSVLTLQQGDAVLTVTHFPAIRIPENEIVSTTGAGDTLVGGLVAGLVNGPGEPKEWVQKALQRVERTMRSRRAVG